MSSKLSMRGRVAIVLLSMVTVSATGDLTGCSHRDGEVEKGGRMAERAIAKVLKDNTDEWMAIYGVEGAAIGLYEGKPCIKIFSSVSAEQLEDKIPSNVEGHPVIIEETGRFRALDHQ